MCKAGNKGIKNGPDRQRDPKGSGEEGYTQLMKVYGLISNTKLQSTETMGPNSQWGPAI